MNEQWLLELAPHFYQREERGAARPTGGLAFRAPTATMGAAAAGDARRESALPDTAAAARSAKRPAPDEPEQEQSGGARVGVAAMLGESLFKRSNNFF